MQVVDGKFSSPPDAGGGIEETPGTSRSVSQGTRWVAPIAESSEWSDGNGVARANEKPQTKEEAAMNEDRIKGNWKQLKGKAKTRWGKLTDDELDVAEGRKDEMIGKIQEKYGVSKEEASKQWDDFRREVA